MPQYKKPLMLALHCADLDRPTTNLINESSVQIYIKPSDDFLELMEATGFTRRGKFSWALPLKDNFRNASKFLKTYGEQFLPATLMPTGAGQETKNLGAYDSINRYSNYETIVQSAYETFSQLREALATYDGFVFPKIVLSDEKKAHLRQTISHVNRSYNYNAAQRLEFEKEKMMYSTLGGVQAEVKNDLLWVRLFPVLALAEKSEEIYMPKLKNVIKSFSAYRTPAEVLKTLKAVYKYWGEDVLDGDNDAVLELLEKSKEVVTIGYAANEPATVMVTVGENVNPLRKERFVNSKFLPGTSTKTPLAEALELQKKNKKIEFMIHPALNDVVKMTNAEPYNGDPRLKPYQREAVGLHLATEIGYVNACSPGLGKTVMQLAAMRAKGKKNPNYRGLIVVEANVRDQWHEECAVWFPEAVAVRITSQADLPDVVDALSERKPVIIITSYAHTLLAYEEREARKAEQQRLNSMTFLKKLKAIQDAPIPEISLGSILLETLWDDIAADEALIIRNGSSKQSNILWDIRKNSKAATALTAVPVNKSPDDIGRLLSWVRNDRHMFTGLPLAERYKTSTAAGAKALFQSFGPLVFRRDTSEIKDELPTTQAHVELLKPTPAEKSLASAAERELKRCYLELVAALEEAEKASKDGSQDKEQLSQAKKSLKEAKGAWLGGTQLARMATSDPAAVLNSSSVGAALLAGQGLVEAAMKTEPTKRVKIIEQLQKRILDGQQIIVFTSFNDVAELLTKSLQEAGINAKAFTGKNGTTRNRARKEFQDGELDVLVCTKAAERGLTLHKASVIYHYDLPWTMESIIQRTGRGVRIGSENVVVEIVFFVMEGTIEQRMSEILVNQGMVASLILDNSRGVNLKNTEISSAMGGLMTASAQTSDDENVVEFGKLLLGI